MRELLVTTDRGKQLIDITNRVLDSLTIESGLVHLFVPSTTAGISCADLDPGTDQDILDALYNMIPALQYRHPHDPTHVADHIWSTIIGPSVVLPVAEKVLLLGQWQRIVFFEFDGPRDRRVVMSEIEGV